VRIRSIADNIYHPDKKRDMTTTLHQTDDLHRPARPPTIVCFGDLVTDLVMAIERLPVVADQVQTIRSISIEPGGAGNFLITAARLGARAVALGTIGEDSYGQAVYDALRAEGVDVSYVQRGAGSVNVLVLVLVDDAGRHVFLAYEGSGDPLTLDARTADLLRRADLLFVPGYALHERRVAAAALPAARIAAEAGVPVMNDLGPVVAEASVRDAALAIVGLSAASLLTSDELQRFSGLEDEAQAAAWMLGLGTSCVVVKRGAAGCAIYSVEGYCAIPGIPVTARDTTAAGDAFAAGFAVQWIASKDALRAAEFANCVGAAKVQKLGSGRQCPTLAEVRAIWEGIKAQTRR
jgi:sugar/nucleoside kinase (ribokinase family)